MNKPKTSMRKLEKCHDLVELAMRQKLVTAFSAVALVLGSRGSALGQACTFPAPNCPSAGTCPTGCAVYCDPTFKHDERADAFCGTKCVGEAIKCIGTPLYTDEMGDVIRLEQAFDMVKGTVRIPAAGNLPLAGISGNAVCTNSNGICDPVNFANCVLPCLMAAGGVEYTDPATGLTLPGLPKTGKIQVKDDQYIIQPGDGSHIASRFTFLSTDLCTTCCFNCPQTCEVYSAGVRTSVTTCNDAVCENGLCVPRVGDDNVASKAGEDRSLGVEDCLHIQPGSDDRVCEPSMWPSCMNCTEDCSRAHIDDLYSHSCHGSSNCGGGDDGDGSRGATHGVACSVPPGVPCR
ncbi:MAG: hypothetical protein HY287_04010 [Planctomycetes bacterium]|nr:hypothetical protein [Planctomycetota bacterium]MBI3833478.1 hypothetical protein [Planctomycetota bacterium]